MSVSHGPVILFWIVLVFGDDDDDKGLSVFTFDHVCMQLWLGGGGAILKKRNEFV